jgi:transcriptional regulator with XRE-family HTH domain
MVLMVMDASGGHRGIALTKLKEGQIPAEAEVLKRLRKELGLNQKQAAEHVGISQQALSLIERGVTSGSSKAALRMLNTYRTIERSKQILAAPRGESRNGNEVVDPQAPGGRSMPPPRKGQPSHEGMFSRHLSIDADGRVLVTISNGETVINYHPDEAEADLAMRFWAAVKAAQKASK